MTLTDQDPTIPDDLVAALQRAAAAVPDAALDPATPTLRSRARRRRRTFTASTVVAALLVGAVVVDRTLVDDRDDVLANGPAQGPAAGGPPSGTFGEPLDPGILDEPLVLPELWAVLQPDGTTVQLPFAQPDDVPGAGVRLTDGRFATLAGRQDGSARDSFASVLAIFDAEGRLVRETTLPAEGRDVSLAGEHDGRVILLRTQDGSANTSEVEVTAVDLTTLVEAPIATVELPRLNGTVGIAGDLLIAVGEIEGAHGLTGPTCAVTATHLATGETSDLPAVPCSAPWSVASSPDGRHAAVAASTAGESEHHTITVTVIDLDRTEIVVSEPVSTAPVTCDETDDPTRCYATPPLTAVWTGDHDVTTLFAPQGAITGSHEGPVLHPERLEAVTITVP